MQNMFHVKIVKMHYFIASWRERAFLAMGSVNVFEMESIGHTFCMFHLSCWAEKPLGVKQSTHLMGDDGGQLTIIQ